MQKNLLETLMGAVVLIVAVAFLGFAYEGSQMRMESGYSIIGKFGNASGISLGSDVRIGGIKVGVISALGLDPNTYEAIVTMQVGQSTKIPKDSSAAIVSSGLLGEKYVELTPGSDDKMMEGGSKVEFTQSAINLEELIGKFMFSGGGVDKNNDKGAASAPASAGGKKPAATSLTPSIE